MEVEGEGEGVRVHVRVCDARMCTGRNACIYIFLLLLSIYDKEMVINAQFPELL